MADIAMCKGDGCILKESCYRYTAKPSLYQSYFINPPLKNGGCDHYWEIKYDKKRKESSTDARENQSV